MSECRSEAKAAVVILLGFAPPAIGVAAFGVALRLHVGLSGVRGGRSSSSSGV